jgi:hypothetical protein
MEICHVDRQPQCLKRHLERERESEYITGNVQWRSLVMFPFHEHSIHISLRQSEVTWAETACYNISIHKMLWILHFVFNFLDMKDKLPSCYCDDWTRAACPGFRSQREAIFVYIST